MTHLWDCWVSLASSYLLRPSSTSIFVWRTVCTCGFWPVRPLVASVCSDGIQLGCACLIWDGCSFGVRDWLLGRLFCLLDIFAPVSGFLLGAPSCGGEPSAPRLVHMGPEQKWSEDGRCFTFTVAFFIFFSVFFFF